MKRNLLLTGGPAHDFEVTSHSLTSLFDEVGMVTTVVDEPRAALALLRSVEADDAERFDLLTVNGLHWSMGAERYAHLRDQHSYTLEPNDATVLERFVETGGGLLALHTAVISFDAEPTWRGLCGAAWNWDRSFHGPPEHTAVTVTPAGHHHILTEGLDDFSVFDEIYESLDVSPSIIPLLSSRCGNRDRPLLWARELGTGRVVTDLLGHGLESIMHPTHRSILQRSAKWASTYPSSDS